MYYKLRRQDIAEAARFFRDHDYFPVWCNYITYDRWWDWGNDPYVEMLNMAQTRSPSAPVYLHFDNSDMFVLMILRFGGRKGNGHGELQD